MQDVVAGRLRVGRPLSRRTRRRARARGPERLGRRGRRALPPPLAGRPPRRVARRARRGGRRGHRPGGVRVRPARARPLRPPPPARPVAAPDRRQPRDRLVARARAAPRDRRRHAPRAGRAGGRRRRSATSSSRALADLGPEHRAVVVLRHLLGYTPGEIAAMLDLPRGTVNSRLRRALDALSLALEERRDDPRRDRRARAGAARDRAAGRGRRARARAPDRARRRARDRSRAAPPRARVARLGRGRRRCSPPSSSPSATAGPAQAVERFVRDIVRRARSRRRHRSADSRCPRAAGCS